MSTTTHTGKIGRLSKDRRHQLSLRIEDGHPGADIVNWLNQQPDVQKILQDQFSGRPISEQNLSDWKHSGHREWLRREEARESALRLIERSDDVIETTHENHLGDRLALLVAEQITRVSLALLEEEPDLEKRWQRLCAIHREVSQLRRDDHRAIRTTFEQERWNLDTHIKEEAHLERVQKAHQERLFNIFLEQMDIPSNTELFGGGDKGRKAAEMLYRLKCGLPREDLRNGTWQPPKDTAPRKSKSTPAKKKATPSAKAKPRKTRANRAKSSLIKPNPARKAPRKPVKRQPTEEPVEGPTYHNVSPPVPEWENPPGYISPIINWRNQPNRSGPGSVPPKPRAPMPATPKPTEPEVTPPINPIPPTPPTPAPALDPKEVAYNTWFRMNNSAEPFDAALLEKLYAAIPPNAP